MALTGTIPVRLTPEVLAQLDATTKRIGTTRAAIIQFCTETWLAHFERSGIASLPPDWKRIIASMDGRTVEYQADAAKEVHYGKSKRNRVYLNEGEK